MLRVNKLTDYAVVVLCDLLRGQALRSAADLSASSGVPLPTVSKILKQLTKAEILQSVRGANGGYGFARRPEVISMTEVIESLEGPIAVTGCVEDSGECCALTDQCPMSGHWNAVNTAIRQSLNDVRLIDMLPESRFMEPTDLVGSIVARHTLALQAQEGEPNR
ncbi:MAG: SUF system Fe-S cluster assembly regulator [Rhodospirillaceae bacterium]|nr:SUF system Fe-S cluster assembly regulator [Rhodospirillaceae bacterium]